MGGCMGEWVGSGQMTNLIKLELINIIWICLKIYNLSRHPYLWVDGWVNGWPHVKLLKSNKSWPNRDNSIMDILDILLDILLKPPQPFIGLFFVAVTVRSVVVARLCFHRHLWFCSQGSGRHPQADTHPLPLPSACCDTHTSLLGRHPRTDTPSAQCMLGYTPLPSACWDTPQPSACWDTPPAQCMLGYTPHPVHAGIHSPLAATAVSGTHPTGIHSCFCFVYFFLLQNSDFFYFKFINFNNMER